MDTDAIKNAYRRYARIYDTLFGRIMHPGRKLIVEALDCKPGGHILEVGVGTGLSLPLYPKHVRVTGIDISEEMLARARRRVAQEHLSQVEAVLAMDGEDMGFADDTCDKVVAMYVVSVVRDPIRLLEEMRRVCKPGGTIVIVNHFRSHNPIVRILERLLAPASNLVGFHPDFDLQDFLRAARLQAVNISNANLFGHWKVLRFQNRLNPEIAA